MSNDVFKSLCSLQSYSTGALGSKTVSLPRGLSLVRDDYDPICSAEMRTRLYWQNTENIARVSSRGSHSVCLDECIVTSGTSPMCTQRGVDGANYTISTEATIACYCSQRLKSEVGSQGIVSGGKALLDVDGALCFGVSDRTPAV